MTDTADQVEDRLADFTRDKRILLLSLMAVVVGVMSAVVAVVWSISLGSGTSGGVLAPLLIIGGALGAVE